MMKENYRKNVGSDMSLHFFMEESKMPNYLLYECAFTYEKLMNYDLKEYKTYNIYYTNLYF